MAAEMDEGISTYRFVIYNEWEVDGNAFGEPV